MKVLAWSRKLLAARDNNGLILLLLACFSLTAAVMHYAFVALTPESIGEAYRIQTSLLRHPGQDARLLSAAAIYLCHLIFRKMFLAMILSEALFAFFSFWSLFTLADKIIRDKAFSLLAVTGMMFYYPLGFQHTTTYGQLLLFGFFSALVYLVLAKKELYFVALLLLASFQRPEIAFSGVMFKLIYDYSERRIWPKVLYDVLLMAVPFAVVWAINHFYAINTSGYLIENMTRTVGNLKGIPLHWSVYAPVLLLVLFNFRRLGRTVYLMLLSLVPYFIMITLAGNYSESRLFLPLAGVLLIGVAYAIKNKGVFTLEKLIS